MYTRYLLLILFFSCGSSDYELKRPAENWPMYGGDYFSQRHSALKQITKANVSDLTLLSRYHIEGAKLMPSTPLVYDGVMYFSENNKAYAIDLKQRKPVWIWNGYPSKLGRSRGVAISDNKLFFITVDCSLVALDRATGKYLWSKKYVDSEGYYCTVAPLIVKDKVIVGVSSGHRSLRGFVAAFSFSGEELWRFWTVPDKNDPERATWGDNNSVGGAATWITGSYDPKLNLLYWPTGNPWPYFSPEERPGDNIYSDSVLALNPDNGELVWYFQFTPGDGHDWDATESLVLTDLDWQGRKRKVLLQANRNGFFYILDRVTGEFLFAKPFVEKLNWASGLTTEGRPIVVSGMEKTTDDPNQNICPFLRGATNWMPPSFNPSTGLFYVVALEQCQQDSGRYFLRAINSQKGSIEWEYLMNDAHRNMTAGVLSTAGDLVFFGDDSEQFICLDALSGKKLWSYDLGLRVFAAPITFTVGGKQYIAVIADSDIFIFTLPDIQESKVNFSN